MELVHNDDIVLTLKKAVQRYDKVVWTTDQEVIVKFLHIGSVCGTLIGYDTEDFIASINAKDLRPTLSPTDSNFPAWWEEHKAEWED